MRLATIHFRKVPGFVEFHLLKGQEADDHTLYASHTVWESRAAFEACDRAVQTLGGYGYMREYDVERYFRECRMLKIAPVSQEMVLNTISEHVLHLPRSY